MSAAAEEKHSPSARRDRDDPQQQPEDEKRKLWIGGAFAIVAVVLAILSWRATTPAPAKIPEAYFSTDDGATYFPGDGKQLPPFEHDGAMAVRAYVFRCKDGKTFVGYLERYTDKAKAVLADIEKRPLTPAEVKTLTMGREYKKPGKDAAWITLTPGEAQMRSIVLRGKMGVKCADGSAPEPVGE